MRALELFAGIGGMPAACPWLQVVAAVDINRDSREVYELNFSTPYLIRELETVSFEWLASIEAELWWMSPPCTPFTRRGRRMGLEDRRARSLVHLVQAVSKVRPEIVVLENVVGFEESDAFELLMSAWSEAGYHVEHLSLCPTQLGWPNRRPRIYVLAMRTSWTSRTDLKRLVPAPRATTSFHPRLQQLLSLERDPWELEELTLDPATIEKYSSALDLVDLDNPQAVAACFGASYGRVLTKAGSYLRMDSGIRRFAPREVANVLGFPESFRFPPHLSTRRLWHLLGNSLSLPVVSTLLQFTRP